MKVVFFSKGDFTVVSSRYRCYYFAEALESNGFETTICTPPPKRLDRRRPLESLAELRRLAGELARVQKGDIAYLQRPIQNSVFVLMLALWKLVFRRKVIFDFCDPIFMHAPRKTRLLTRLADTVIVSCEDFAVWARQHNPNVHVVPNSYRFTAEEEPALEPPENQTTVIGWAGSAKDHKDNLRLIFPVLSRLSSDFRFRLIGARGADDLVEELTALGIPLEVIDWVEPERAATELSRFDIAVLPALDLPWNRKLMTKLIDYLAVGAAVVASPVGENQRALSDGENGLLASSEAEWIEKLERLLNDPSLRRRLGEKAKETVHERYSLDASGKRLAHILRATLVSAPPAPHE